VGFSYTHSLIMEGTQDMGMANTTTATNATAKPTIILVHGGWADGSSWGKVITTLKNA
jgi:pimeloyl-ACP methyl ester carboxylesterase